MKKAKIYKPSKTAMQSGTNNSKNWIIEFKTRKPAINPLITLSIPYTDTSYTDSNFPLGSTDALAWAITKSSSLIALK